MAEATTAARPVALDVQQPDSFKTIGNILNFVGKAQEVGQAQQVNPLNLQLKQQEARTGEIGLSKLEQANKERLAAQDFFSNPANWQTNGRYDLDKINATLPKIAPLTGNDLIEKFTTVHKAQTEALKARQAMTQDMRAIWAVPMSVLGRGGNTDPNVYIKEGEFLKKQNPDNSDFHRFIDANNEILKTLPPGPHVAQMAIKTAESLLTPEGAYQHQAPRAALTDVGGRVQQTTVQPSVMGGAPAISAGPTNIQKTLPPTATTPNAAGQSEYVGQPENYSGTVPQTAPNLAPPNAAVPGGMTLPQGVQSARDNDRLAILKNELALQQRTGKVDPALLNEISAMERTGAPRRLAAGPAPGQIESVKGTAETVNKDFENTLSLAKNAGQDIGVLNNIKKYAPGAITGVESDRRAYITGIAGLLGIDAAQIGKTNTDLLVKNANMQALGGNTDAARILLEGANPNAHMTKEAITAAANQVIAQRRMALERQKILTPIKGLIDSGLVHHDVYNSALQKLNTLDPRVLQLPEMSKKEKEDLMRSMTDQEQTKFINMVREAHKLGIGK